MVDDLFERGVRGAEGVVGPEDLVARGVLSLILERGVGGVHLQRSVVNTVVVLDVVHQAYLF